MLMSVWYAFSGIVGLILTIVAFLLVLFTPMVILIGVPDAIKDRDWGMFIGIIIFTIISIGVCGGTYALNYNVSKEHHLVSEEVSNIQGYDGVGNESSGKSHHDYFYFKQGTNNSYYEYKVLQSQAVRHDSQNGKVKVIINHTEYTSPFRYLGIFSLNPNEYYDIYIPK